jgi:hypothetical protein
MIGEKLDFEQRSSAHLRTGHERVAVGAGVTNKGPW